MNLLHKNTQKVLVINLNKPVYNISLQFTILIIGESNIKNANEYKKAEDLRQ